MKTQIAIRVLQDAKQWAREEEGGYVEDYFLASERLKNIDEDKEIQRLRKFMGIRLRQARCAYRRRMDLTEAIDILKKEMGINS